MNLTNRSIETLLDLAENKLSDIVPFDREDVREIRALQIGRASCRERV